MLKLDQMILFGMEMESLKERMERLLFSMEKKKKTKEI